MKKTTTKKTAKKKQPNKQRLTRATSFIRIAKELRELGGGYISLTILRRALNNEAKRLRAMR